MTATNTTGHICASDALAIARRCVEYAGEHGWSDLGVSDTRDEDDVACATGVLKEMRF
ncbi:MAG: hypothetical protein ACTSU0_06040 [Alphaproteobacteria bacterium]